MNQNEEFTTIDIEGYGECVIIQAKGIHYFNAMRNASGNINMIVWYLILELVKVKGKMIDEETLNGMDLSDVLKLSEIIAVMMGGLPK